MKNQKLFYLFIHVTFVTGVLYAIYHFLRTPRSLMEMRRMWAYESWIILSSYCLFIFLILMEDKKLSKATDKINHFKNTLLVNLILLVFPWGLFLLLAPEKLMTMLGLNSLYWRILGGMSLAGAAIYYLPYRYLNKKISYYIMVFGAYDNLLAGLVIAVLFFLNQVPLMAFAFTPILWYFAYFFWEQSQAYKSLTKALNKLENR